MVGGPNTERKEVLPVYEAILNTFADAEAEQTARDIAHRASRPAGSVRRELARLVNLGVLRVVRYSRPKSGGSPAYVYGLG